MPRKKKEEKVVEIEEVSIPEESVMIQAPPEDMPPVALRLQLLGLSKEILEHQSHLAWETHTKFIDVSIEDIIEGAKDLLDFVLEQDD